MEHLERDFEPLFGWDLSVDVRKRREYYLEVLSASGEFFGTNLQLYNELNL